ncbi:hypothetical protein N7470_009312 [Penicillium chermesinum]|nr:hypothetical protein N7470_009312 [Penicillium chermesinum]
MWAAINTCLALVSQLGLDWILTNATGCRSMLRLTTNMPMPWGTFWKILFAFFGREVLTYLSHRWLLHWRTDAYVGFDVVPVYLSSWHRSWYHSLHTLYPFTAHYDHPGAYIFGRFLPQYIPVVFMRMHCLEYFLYITIVSLEELCVYSGYGTDLTRLSIGVSSKWFIGGWEVQAHEHLMNRRINFSPWGLGDALAGAFQGERVSPPRPQSQPSQSRSQLEAQRGQYHVTARDMTRRR